jgi:hypothetical protein
MSEVCVSRQYDLKARSIGQARRVASNLSRFFEKIVSSNTCKTQVKLDNDDPKRIIVNICCVDGKAVYYADVRGMFRLLELCERQSIPHEVGSLDVQVDY